jgi:hypothetical protein
VIETPTTTKARAVLASNAKKKTTFAKLKREQDVRERRERKQQRRESRRDGEPATMPAPTPAVDDAHLNRKVEGVLTPEEEAAIGPARTTPPA